MDGISVTEQSGKAGAVASRALPAVVKDLLYLLLKIGVIALVVVLFFTFLFGLIRCQEPWMSPAIKDGDLVIFYRYTSQGYLPQDVIALDYRGERHVRRVVAVEGDTVDITSEQGLIVNGSIQQELEIIYKTERYEEGVDFPLIVPEGHVFVLGDRRDGATDSRIYGCVKISDTQGKVITILRKRGI